MRLTRHARNKLRLEGWLTWDLAESLVVPSNRIAPDPDGKPRYRAGVAGREVTVVVALDNPDLIITIYVD